MEAAPATAAAAPPPQAAAAGVPAAPADAQQPAPAPAAGTSAPAQPGNPTELAAKLVKGAAMLPTAVGSTGAAVVQLASILKQQGELPQSVSDTLQRIGIITKLTDAEVVDPAKAGELPEELKADPIKGVQILEAQLLDTIGKMSTAFDGAAQALQGVELTEEVGKQLGSAAGVVEQAKMAVWAATKLVPPPQAAPAEGEQQQQQPQPAAEQAAPAPAAG